MSTPESFTPTEEAVGLVGISHRTAPFDVLERLALSAEEIAGFQQKQYSGDSQGDG